jgi:hypothetical protein
MVVVGEDWSRTFYATLQEDQGIVGELLEASLAGDLARWNTSLTGLVAETFCSLGLDVAAKGHRCSVLAVPREEYLALHMTVLPARGRARCFPAAVCEFENPARDDVVAYALWKILCIRSALRVVFCYRAARDHAPGLVSTLAEQVVAAMSVTNRQRLRGDTLVFVGSRSESSTFPYGFFHAWRLNRNTGGFEIFAWQE